MKIFDKIFVTSVAIFGLCGQTYAADRIGVIGAVNPNVNAIGDDQSTRTLSLGADIFFKDKITADANGNAQLMFVDKSALTVGPNSSVTIDEFVYNPDTSGGNMVMKGTKGTFRFIGGALSKKDAVQIKTPVGTIGIRGGIAVIDIDPLNGATNATFVYGEMMSFQNLAGDIQTVTERGMGMALDTPNAMPEVFHVTSEQIAATIQTLGSQPGMSAGATEVPDDSAINSGIKLDDADNAPAPTDDGNTPNGGTPQDNGGNQDGKAKENQDSGDNRTGKEPKTAAKVMDNKTQKNSDGSTTTTKTYANGTTETLTESKDGKASGTRILADGTRETMTEDGTGNRTMTRTMADGTTETRKVNADGSGTMTKTGPNGQTYTQNYGPNTAAANGQPGTATAGAAPYSGNAAGGSTYAGTGTNATGGTYRDPATGAVYNNTAGKTGTNTYAPAPGSAAANTYGTAPTAGAYAPAPGTAAANTYGTNTYGGAYAAAPGTTAANTYGTNTYGGAYAPAPGTTAANTYGTNTYGGAYAPAPGTATTNTYYGGYVAPTYATGYVAPTYATGYVAPAYNTYGTYGTYATPYTATNTYNYIAPYTSYTNTVYYAGYVDPYIASYNNTFTATYVDTTATAAAAAATTTTTTSSQTTTTTNNFAATHKGYMVTNRPATHIETDLEAELTGDWFKIRKLGSTDASQLRRQNFEGYYTFMSGDIANNGTFDTSFGYNIWGGFAYRRGNATYYLFEDKIAAGDSFGSGPQTSAVVGRSISTLPTAGYEYYDILPDMLSYFNTVAANPGFFNYNLAPGLMGSGMFNTFNPGNSQHGLLVNWGRKSFLGGTLGWNDGYMKITYGRTTNTSIYGKIFSMSGVVIKDGFWDSYTADDEIYGDSATNRVDGFLALSDDADTRSQTPFVNTGTYAVDGYNPGGLQNPSGYMAGFVKDHNGTYLRYKGDVTFSKNANGEITNATAALVPIGAGSNLIRNFGGSAMSSYLFDNMYALEQESSTEDGVLVASKLLNSNFQCTSCNFVHWGVWAGEVSDGTYTDTARMIPYVAGVETTPSQITSLATPPALQANYSGNVLANSVISGALNTHTGNFNAALTIGSGTATLKGFNTNITGIGTMNYAGGGVNLTGADFINVPISGVSGLNGSITGSLFGPQAQNIGGNMNFNNGAGGMTGTGVYLGNCTANCPQ